MSDVVNTSNPGTTAPEKKNPYKEAILNNCTELLAANENGTACYLGGTEQNGKIVIKTEKPITNAINGNEIRGTNQLVLQNAFRKAGLNDREVVVHDQIEKVGIKVKKNSPYVNITLPTDFDMVDGKKIYKPNIIREYPKSSCFVFDEQGKPKSPAGDFALAKLNFQRFGKIKRMRAISHNDRTTEEQRTKLLESIAWEHKKAIDFLNVTNGDVADYRAKNVQPEEAKYLADIEAKNPNTPTLEQQKGRAYNELKRQEEFLASKAAETPVIDATNTKNPVDYVGKYMAACKIGADFETDKESQTEVQSRLTDQLKKSFDANDYDSAFTFGAECEERAKAVISEFRSKSHDQQRGIATERPIVQERPEQTVDAISF